MSSDTTVTADPDVVSLVSTICADLADSTAPQDGSVDLRAWRTLDQSGLLSLVDTDDPQGLAHAAAVVESVARHRLAVPSGEHDMMGRWAAQAIGLDVPQDGPLITTLVDRSGRSTRVPWARNAHSFLVISRTADGLGAGLVAPDQVEITPGLNHAGDARDDIAVDATALAAAQPIDPTFADTLYLRGAYVRAVQTVGAMSAAVDASLNYAGEREQFGRPIARFPLVQRMLVESINESQLAAAAVDHATATLAEPTIDDDDKIMAVAMARSVVAHAAGIVTRHSHQVHGAIGTTAEHPLHRSTQTMEAWCSEFGSTAHWEKHIAGQLRASDRSVWDMIA